MLLFTGLYWLRHVTEETDIRFKAIIFDLDGTLLDTLKDLADAMNAAIVKLGFHPHPVDAYRYFVGDSLEIEARRALPKNALDDETVKKCCEISRAEYAEKFADNTVPYPGIPELLTTLQSRGIPQAILSNKPDDFTQLTVRKLLPGFEFDIVLGLKPPLRKKPDPTAALSIAEKLKVKPADILYLGDTNTDMQTAVNAGMYPVGALWGFRTAEELLKNGAKYLAQKPPDILKLMDSDDL